jgi:predicted ester cyclase
MKKIFSIAFAGMVCICTSCNNKPATTTDDTNMAQEQKNMAAFNDITNAFQTGDAGRVDSVVADDFVDHSDKGDIKGKDSLKAMITMMHNNFKDMKTEVRNTAANGDYVYGWMTYSGTSDGNMGIPKGPFKMSAVELAKFKDGKAVEHWGFMDMQDMAKMMPQPGMSNMNKMDTGKMKK